MSSNNDNSGASLAGFLLAAVACMAIFFFAVAAFITFVLTIFCLLSWNRRLFIGPWTIEPRAARAFVGRGLTGMGLLPAFFLFCELFLGVSVNWDYMPYYLLTGYILGSLGLEILIQKAQENQDTDAIGPNAPVAPPSAVLPAPQREPFRFASWDDEEEAK